MKTYELKRIPIWELLSHLGIEPVSKRGGGAQLLYHSPLRPDRNASFSVSTRKNLWMDFGTSQGGNVIDLAIALKGLLPFPGSRRMAGGAGIFLPERHPLP